MGASAASAGPELVARLREAIIEGHLAPGTRLGEQQLAREHGVARSTARQAIASLVATGLVQSQRNVGARVCELSEADLRQLYEVREALEGMAARLAARNMSDTDVDAVRGLLAGQARELRRNDDPVYLQGEHDLDFHCRLASGSRNALLERQLTSDLYDRLRLYRRQFGMVGPRARPAFQEHQQILDAIADRDGEMAEMLMRRHIRASLANIRRRMYTGRASSLPDQAG